MSEDVRDADYGALHLESRADGVKFIFTGQNVVRKPGAGREMRLRLDYVVARLLLPDRTRREQFCDEIRSIILAGMRCKHHRRTSRVREPTVHAVALSDRDRV